MVQAGGAVGAAKALAVVGFVQLAATVTILQYLETRRNAHIS
jgi:hypothetical protein